MTQLKALERDCPLIDSNFQIFCASHGIFTVEDFLLHDVYELAALAEQDVASEKFKQGITEILTIIDGQHQPWFNGLDLLKDAEHKKCILSTGCERIDALLEGGLHVGHVTELVGASSSGKTQVCLLAASSIVGRYLGKVMYFNSGNSFSSKRVAQFLQSSYPSSTKGNKALQQILNNILYHSVFDIFTLQDMLHQLKNNLKTQMDNQVRMLIIDSLSSLIATVLGGGANGHALMVSTGFLLKELAHEYNLSIVVTNHMVAGEAGSLKPALGESWKTIPHVRLMLSRQQHGNNVGRISVIKHPYLAAGRTMEFVIT